MSANRLFFVLVCWAYYALPAVAQKENPPLAYTPEVMNRLKFIVDSMHIKYRKCDLNKQYLSLPQTLGYAINAKENLKELKKDLEANMPLAKLRTKYPQAISPKPVLITKSLVTNYYDKQETHFEVWGYGREELNLRRPSDWYKKQPKQKAIFDYYDNEDYKLLRGIYIDTKFAIQTIPNPYARQILYADCMIDTTARVILVDKEEEDLSGLLKEFEELVLNASKEYHDKNPFPAESEFAKEFIENDKMPTAQDMEHIIEKGRGIGKVRQKWHENSQAYIQAKIKAIPNTQQYFENLVNVAIKTNQSSELLEEYLTPYISKAQLLELKRRRQVVGSCSMDNSPIHHALEIAELSAETAKWEIFLRSHLDVMNDRFERVSDGSYAQAGRSTYFAELEALDIEAFDLLLGTLFHGENMAKGHYHGNVMRIGRAFAETSKNAEIEKKMLDIIADEKLDVFNRVLVCYVFLNYNYFLKDEMHKKENKLRLKTVAEKSSAPFIFENILKVGE